jgi:hypothetical protein
MLAILKKIFKVLLYTLGGIIAFNLLVAILPLIFGLFTSDIDPIDDSDFKLKKIVIREEDNAFYDLVKFDPNYGGSAEVKFDKTKDGKDEYDLLKEHVDGEVWDEEFVKEVLAKNQEALTHFYSAADKPKYQMPDLEDPESIENYMLINVPSFSTYRNYSYLSALQALYLVRKGRADEALNKALIPVRIGQVMQNSQILLLPHLIALANKGIGLEAIRQIIATSNLSSEKLKELTQQLNAFYDNEDGLATAFKFEYQRFANLIDIKVSTGKFASASKDLDILDIFPTDYEFYFRPNETKLIYADYYRELIKSVYKPWIEIKDKNLDIEGIDELSIKSYFMENSVGKMIVSFATSSYKSYIRRNIYEDMMVSATQAMAAIKAYKIDNSRLPGSLDELTPDYIEAVPTDPFDAKPIKYSAAKKIIYSVGEDLKDSGGSEGEDWADMEDPTFSIDF